MNGSNEELVLKKDVSMTMLEVEGSFLLLRKGSGSMGTVVGKWTLPEGQALPKETFRAAARRSLYMNTNINIPEDWFVTVGELEDDVSRIHLFYARLGGSNTTTKNILESVKAFILRPLCHNEFCDAAFVPRELLRRNPDPVKMMERMKNSLSVLMRDTEKSAASEEYSLTEITARAVAGYLPYPVGSHNSSPRPNTQKQQTRSRT